MQAVKCNSNTRENCGQESNEVNCISLTHRNVAFTVFCKALVKAGKVLEEIK